ncbi:hypothetical protein KL86DES1_20791 [uncultured Desulfovibrio sp.]|uniref:Uncharacterized protein n=1 Tax=uncultured Desulfovibrio sp. TaxID=167968 RepID=A0A212L598_9BACT|nr:hypothetical protein KL86DES1_20791 [uncultured Desulfovibrio sp.]VZH33692.1 conserved protein of unknown function [Desulfovibrio sp. 86]
MQPKTLLAQAKLLNQRAVALNVGLLQVVQNIAATANKLQQARAGVKVLLVLFEVTGEVFNTGSKQGNLHFRGAGVAFMFGVGVNDRFLLSYIHYHSSSP